MQPGEIKSHCKENNDQMNFKRHFSEEKNLVAPRPAQMEFPKQTATNTKHSRRSPKDARNATPSVSVAMSPRYHRGEALNMLKIYNCICRSRAHLLRFYAHFSGAGALGRRGAGAGSKLKLRRADWCAVTSVGA